MKHARILAMGLVLGISGLGGCHLSPEPRQAVREAADEKGALGEAVEAPAPPKIDWVGAGDCRAKLDLLRRELGAGPIETLDDTPFLLIADQPSVIAASWSAVGRSGLAGSDLDEARPCVIRMGEARDQASDHRVLSQERVRSSYQSGSHWEKNPAYEAAQVRLRQAERDSKPGKSSIVSVGDPLIDLVGTLIGGAITGVGQWSEGDPVEEAIDALMATPRSIEQPIYRPYHFERTWIRASREAVIPLVMTDRERGRSWRISLRRREHRDLALLDGLDKQDRNYADHRENGMTDQEFRRWRAEPPALPLDDMVASLLGAPASSFPDRAAGPNAAGGGPVISSADEDLDAAASQPAFPPASPAFPPASPVFPPAPKAPPSSYEAALSHETAAHRPSPHRTGRRKEADRGRWRPDGVHGFDMTGEAPSQRESVVQIVGPEQSGQGVYVAPFFVLTTSDLVEGKGLIDVIDAEGKRVLGLVARVDPSYGLALVQAPRPGHPVLVSAARPDPAARLKRGRTTNGGDPRLRQVTASPADALDGRASERLSPEGAVDDGRHTVSGPFLDGQRLLGFRSRQGPDISLSAIKAFLAEQETLLISRR